MTFKVFLHRRLNFFQNVWPAHKNVASLQQQGDLLFLVFSHKCELKVHLPFKRPTPQGGDICNVKFHYVICPVSLDNHLD